MTKTRISQHASASGRITVDEVDLEGKFIRLSNKADEVSDSVCQLAFQTILNWFKFHGTETALKKVIMTCC